MLRSLEPDIKLITLVLLQAFVQKLLELKLLLDLYISVINTDSLHSIYAVLEGF